MDEFVNEADIDVGNLDPILAAVRGGNRKQEFPIPDKLTPSRQQILALPVDQRQASKKPRLLLRKDIDAATRGYWLRMEIKNPSALTKQSMRINETVRTLHELMGLSGAGAREADLVLQHEHPALMAYLSTKEAKAAMLTVSRENVEKSATDWIIDQLRTIFEKHFRAGPTTSLVVDKAGRRNYYSPFIAFVLAVAKEAGIKIASATIHRFLTTKPEHMPR
ncbi:hypothetical protein ACXHXG_29855 [Rhizobium sp. LEGMi198b]